MPNTTPIERVRAVLAACPSEISAINLITTIDSSGPSISLSIDDIRHILRIADDCREAERHYDELRAAIAADTRMPHRLAVEHTKSMLSQHSAYADSAHAMAHLLELPAGTDVSRDVLPAVRKLKLDHDSARYALNERQRQFETAIQQRDEADAKLSNAIVRAPQWGRLIDLLTELHGNKAWFPNEGQTPEAVDAVFGLIRRMHAERRTLEDDGNASKAQAWRAACDALTECFGENWSGTGIAADVAVRLIRGAVKNAERANEARRQAQDELADVRALLNQANLNVESVTQAFTHERATRQQSQSELADLRGHCSRIEAENQRYRGSTLDAKAAHESLVSAVELEHREEVARRMGTWVKHASLTAAHRWVYIGPTGNVYASMKKPAIFVSKSDVIPSGWIVETAAQKKIGFTSEIELRARWQDTLTAIPARRSEPAHGEVDLSFSLGGIPIKCVVPTVGDCDELAGMPMVPADGC